MTMNLFLESLFASGCRDIYSLIAGYIERWQWPRRVHDRRIKELFDKKRRDGNVKATYFKCSASDGLSLYSVVAYFVQSVILPTKRCECQCRAFIKLCDLIDGFVAIPRGLVTGTHLLQLAETFLQSFEKAWGLESTTPKFHWLLHMGGSLTALWLFFCKVVGC